MRTRKAAYTGCHMLFLVLCAVVLQVSELPTALHLVGLIHLRARGVVSQRASECRRLEGVTQGVSGWDVVQGAGKVDAGGGGEHVFLLRHVRVQLCGAAPARSERSFQLLTARATDRYDDAVRAHLHWNRKLFSYALSGVRAAHSVPPVHVHVEADGIGDSASEQGFRREHRAVAEEILLLGGSCVVPHGILVELVGETQEARIIPGLQLVNVAFFGGRDLRAGVQVLGVPISALESAMPPPVAFLHPLSTKFYRVPCGGGGIEIVRVLVQILQGPLAVPKGMISGGLQAVRKHLQRGIRSQRTFHKLPCGVGGLQCEHAILDVLDRVFVGDGFGNHVRFPGRELHSHLVRRGRQELHRGSFRKGPREAFRRAVLLLRPLRGKDRFLLFSGVALAIGPHASIGGEDLGIAPRIPVVFVLDGDARERTAVHTAREHAVAGVLLRLQGGRVLQRARTVLVRGVREHVGVPSTPILDGRV